MLHLKNIASKSVPQRQPMKIGNQVLNNSIKISCLPLLVINILLPFLNEHFKFGSNFQVCLNQNKLTSQVKNREQTKIIKSLEYSENVHYDYLYSILTLICDLQGIWSKRAKSSQVFKGSTCWLGVINAKYILIILPVNPKGN